MSGSTVMNKLIHVLKTRQGLTYLPELVSFVINLRSLGTQKEKLRIICLLVHAFFFQMKLIFIKDATVFFKKRIAEEKR